MPAVKEGLISDTVREQIISIASKLAMLDGARNVTVRKILGKMNVTNRVFYNRFHNIDEVLQIVYSKAVQKMPESLKFEIDITKDFFGYVMDITVRILISTYDVKKQFSQYMFEYDSFSEENCLWWTNEIKKMIEIAKEKGQISQEDSDLLSYTMWCFCTGYNASKQ